MPNIEELGNQGLDQGRKGSRIDRLRSAIRHDSPRRITTAGQWPYLALPLLTRVRASVPEGATVTVDISVNYLDHAAHQAITDWQRQYEATAGTVRIQGVVTTGHFAYRSARVLVEPEKREAAA
jgi:carbonic anhydrase